MMKKLLLITVVICLVSACGQTLATKQVRGAIKENNIPSITENEGSKDAIFRKLVETKFSLCHILINEIIKPLKVNEVVDCIESATFEMKPFLIKRILEREEKVSRKILSRVLEVIAQDPYSGIYSKTIKKLMDAGASTKNINLQLVQKDGNNHIACNSVILILRSNKDLYLNKSRLNNKPSSLNDLHYLADTGNGRELCSSAILLLASYNSELLNVQDYRGFTPLHYYLEDSNHPQWDVKTAKILMTKENINMQIHMGHTALQMLINHSKTRWDLDLIKTGLELGADINIKNKKDISLKDLILKRPELRSVLK